MFVLMHWLIFLLMHWLFFFYKVSKNSNHKNSRDFFNSSANNSSKYCSHANAITKTIYILLK